LIDLQWFLLYNKNAGAGFSGLTKKVLPEAVEEDLVINSTSYAVTVFSICTGY
jgi:hypothetical protein